MGATAALDPEVQGGQRSGGLTSGTGPVQTGAKTNKALLSFREFLNLQNPQRAEAHYPVWSGP